MYTAYEEGVGEPLPVRLQLLVTFYMATPCEKRLCLSESILKTHDGSFLGHAFVSKCLLIQQGGKVKTLATDQKMNENLNWISVC